MTDLKARIIRPALVAGALLAGSLALATPAFASTATHASPASPAARHNECRSWEEELISWPLEPRYRVLAECSYINPAEKARGVLDLVGQGDAHTDWFTQTGVIYESSWRTPLFGVRGTRMEYEPRLRRAGNLAGRSRSRTRARYRPRAAAN
jgi:hypothetical protein